MYRYINKFLKDLKVQVCKVKGSSDCAIVTFSKYTDSERFVPTGCFRYTPTSGTQSDKMGDTPTVVPANSYSTSPSDTPIVVSNADSSVDFTNNPLGSIVNVGDVSLGYRTDPETTRCVAHTSGNVTLWLNRQLPVLIKDIDTVYPLHGVGFTEESFQDYIEIPDRFKHLKPVKSMRRYLDD